MTALSPSPLRARKRAGAARGPTDWVAVARRLADGFRATAVRRDRDNLAPRAELRSLRRSGLVNLLIPRRFGGEGGTIGEAARVVLELARGDASLAMLYTFHSYPALTPSLLAQNADAGAGAVLRQSAEGSWLWGNITQYLKKAFVAAPHPDGGYVLNGTKAWNTGAPLADRTVILARRAESADYVYAFLPTDRAGVKFHDDWSVVGLRGADSARVTFRNVRIRPDEVLPWDREAEPNGPVPFWNIFRLLCTAAIYLGVAQEVLAQAKGYLGSEGRLHLLPGSEGPLHDPFLQSEFGDLSIQVRAALAYFDQVAGQTEAAWEAWDRLPPGRRQEAQIEASALRSFATQVALAVTPRIYDFTGGRATDNRFGFDRYWRDVRMLSMHDPVAYSIRGAGAFWLTGRLPTLSTHLESRPAVPPSPTSP